MHKGKYVFAQLLDFIDKDVFAVRIQIYSAIIAYCMMAIVQKKMNVERSIYEMVCACKCLTYRHKPSQRPLCKT